MTARLVAVLSTERSGSTLLTLMLAGHPRVLVPPELHLLRYAELGELDRHYPPAMQSVSWLQQHLGRTGHEGCEGSTLDTYRGWLGALPDHSFLVDKTPAYARELSVLARLEQLEPLYVHLVRHPLAVALSWIKVRDRRRTQALEAARGRNKLAQRALAGRDRLKAVTQQDLRERVRYWTTVHQHVLTHLERVPRGRWVRLHYEDLVQKPAQALGPVTDLLGLPLVDAMLSPRDNAPGALAWGVGDENVLNKKRIEASGADAWRERVRSEVSVGPSTRALMQQLGCR